MFLLVDYLGSGPAGISQCFKPVRHAARWEGRGLTRRRYMNVNEYPYASWPEMSKQKHPYQHAGFMAIPAARRNGPEKDACGAFLKKRAFAGEMDENAAKAFPAVALTAYY